MPKVQCDETVEHKNYPHRLHLRNHTYYIRVALPVPVAKLAKKKQLCYTLRTKDYQKALILLRKESFKVDILIDSLRKLAMEIKDGKVVLTDKEIQQFLVFRMNQIDNFFNSFYDNASAEVMDLMFEELPLFTEQDNKAIQQHYLQGNFYQEKNAKIKEREEKVQYLYYQYLQSLSTRSDCKLTTRKMIADIINNKCKVLNTNIINDTKKNGDEYGNDCIALMAQLSYLDDYARSRYNNVLNHTDNNGFGYSPMFDVLLRASRKLDEMELTAIPTTNTRWQDVFDDMVRPKRKGVSASTIDQKKKCIGVMMELLDKEYVEQITFDDIKNLSRLIYKVPKKWQKNNSNQRLLDVLLEDEDDPRGLSPASISKYITMFKEFLRYCREQRLVSEDYAGILKTPTYNKKDNTYLPFTKEELAKIFAPQNYCKLYKSNGDNASFWIPLIALFCGARLNEVCQIRMEDVKTEDNIVYLDIQKNHPLQSLKNPQSARRVPIHPVLKKLGFIQFIHQQQKKKEEWLFPSLLKQYHKKNKFGRKVGRTFANHLTNLGIIDKKKVFHSLRHTVRPKLRDECHLSIEYIDALCGWESGNNSGALNYSHRNTIPITLLYQYISKLSYPEIDFKEMKARMDRMYHSCKI